MNRPEKATTVTIIGAGLGGVALVANLGLLGYRLPPARSR
jgi:NADH dehydrogenase FAD-containing subunit